MPNYNSYYLYQRYVKYPSNPDYIPVIPSVYSIDAEGTMPLVLNIENDVACGYKPPVEPIYRWQLSYDTSIATCYQGNKYYSEVYQVSNDEGLTWENVIPLQTRQSSTIYQSDSPDCIEYRWVNIDITTDYICDDCPEPQRRTVTAYTCHNYDKYQYSETQISYDNWATYTVESSGETLIETNSEFCGYVAPQYRWTVSTGYVCSGTNKMTREIEEVSNDSGVTWTATGNERAALPVIEADSTDCGYVPPTPSFKWKATYTGGSTTSAECDSSSAISQDEITLTNLQSVELGDCVTSIADVAFGFCSSLASVTIPDSVTTIGNYVFTECSGLFSVTVESTTPPSLGSDAFTNTSSNLVIYVPASSVSAYKSATNWSNYASRIQAIP